MVVKYAVINDESKLYFKKNISKFGITIDKILQIGEIPKERSKNG